MRIYRGFIVVLVLENDASAGGERNYWRVGEDL